MGEDKACLPFGKEAMLQRVLRLMLEGLGPLPIAVAAAAGQRLPALPAGVLLAEDAVAGAGPVEGLCAGLRRLSGTCDAAVVTSCDVPLLVPGVLPILQGAIGSYDAAVVAESGGQLHPLCAAWRVAAVSEIERLKESGERRLKGILGQLRTVVVPAAELVRVDPQLDSLWNVNDRQSYAAALKRADLGARCES
jgi:molybdopterin-guanine dinucleotide biosynthesis protein A